VASLKAYLRRDGLLLGAALLLAVVVWKYANDELTEAKPAQVRLTSVVPKGLVVVSGPPASLTVTLSGTRRRLAAVDPAGVAASLQLPDAEGHTTVQLSEKHFSLPEGVFLAEPPHPFEVVLEKPMTRKFPVRVSTMGRPAAGFVLLGTLAEPAEVTVVGPKEQFERLDRQGVTQVETESVDLAGRKQSFVTHVKLDLRSELVPQESVKAVVEIGAEPVVRAIAGVEVKVLVPSGFELRARVEGTVSVSLRGDPRLLEALSADPKGILAMADVAALGKVKPGTLEVPVRLQLPAGVQLAPGTAAPRVQIHLSEK
jgi:YbbR domain-containing protein